MTLSTAVDTNRVSRVVGIKTEFTNLRGLNNILFLPQSIALLAQANTGYIFAQTGQRVTSAAQVATLYGAGSPAHLAARQMFPANGDGVGTVPVTVYGLTTPAGSRSASLDVFVGLARVTLAVTEPFSGRFTIGGVRCAEFVVPAGTDAADALDTMAASINGTPGCPATAEAFIQTTADPVEGGGIEVLLEEAILNVRSRFEGAAGNDIEVTVESTSEAFPSVSGGKLGGGVGTPSLDSALAQFGDEWHTILVNTVGSSDSTLDTLLTFGTGRAGPLTKRHCWAIRGYNGSKEDATETTATRTGDFVNCQIPAYNSPSHPAAIAGRAAARIAVSANNKPSRDYSRLILDGIIAGTEGDQPDNTERELAVTSGASTTVLKNGFVTLSDTVTHHNPEDEDIAPLRFVSDIVKLQNAVFNYDLVFESDRFDGPPLIPNDEPTTDREAVRPRNLVQAANGVTAGLGLAAILTDTAATQAETQFQISAQNPKRADGVVPIRLSGTLNILSLDLDYGFFFGTNTLVNT